MNAATDPALAAMEHFQATGRAVCTLSRDEALEGVQDPARAEAAGSEHSAAYRGLATVTPTSLNGCLALLRWHAGELEAGQSDEVEAAMLRNVVRYLRGAGVPDAAAVATAHHWMLERSFGYGPGETSEEAEMADLDAALAAVREASATSLPGALALVRWSLAIVERQWCSREITDDVPATVAAALRQAVAHLSGRAAA